MDKPRKLASVQLKKAILEKYNSQEISLNIEPNKIRQLLIKLIKLNKLSKKELLNIKDFFKVDLNKSLIKELEIKNHYSKLRSIQNFFKANNSNRIVRLDSLLDIAAILINHHEEILEFENFSINESGSYLSNNFIEEKEARKLLNIINYTKEDNKNEWMVYEVAFLWYEYEPPSIERHFSLMTSNILRKKMDIHRTIESGKLNMTKSYEFETQYLSIQKTIEFDKGVEESSKEINIKSNTKPNAVGVTRFVSRLDLIEYAKSLGEKPKFLFPNMR